MHIMQMKGQAWNSHIIYLLFSDLEEIINNSLLFQTDIDDLKRQNGILDQQGMAFVFGKS